eukprot:1008145-Rhodomonas_salina.1
MSGTDLAYGAVTALRDAQLPPSLANVGQTGIRLISPRPEVLYAATPGHGLALARRVHNHAGLLRYLLPLPPTATSYACPMGSPALALVRHYGIPGTDVAYGPTRVLLYRAYVLRVGSFPCAMESPVLTRRVVLR